MKVWFPLLLVLLGSSAFADTDLVFPVSDVIRFEVKAMGNVSFFHKAHALALGCKSCHDSSLSTLVTDKASAHKLCKGCHITKEAGPIRCPSCHKK